MTDEKFLSFKGLKHYDPGMGWVAVSNFSNQPMPVDAAPDNAPSSQPEQVLQDPLLGELFEQLHQPPQDELAHNWKVIATSVSILSQRMNQQRELRQRLLSIDQELDKLRSTILQDLQEIQRASDQQLSMAKLRAEVSSLAQARLSSKLRRTN